MVDYASTMDLVDDVGDKVQCDLVGAWDEPELGERARALLKSITLYIFPQHASDPRTSTIF